MQTLYNIITVLGSLAAIVGTMIAFIALKLPSIRIVLKCSHDRKFGSVTIKITSNLPGCRVESIQLDNLLIGKISNFGNSGPHKESFHPNFEFDLDECSLLIPFSLTPREGCPWPSSSVISASVRWRFFRWTLRKPINWT